MGQPKVQGSDSGFFTRLGRAIDAVGNVGVAKKTAPTKVDVVDAKPLPTKYAATSNRVVRGSLSNYVTKALKIAEAMRKHMATRDHWYNSITPKDVDKVVEKYKPLIVAAKSYAEKNAFAKAMLKDLFASPVGTEFFWNLNLHLYNTENSALYGAGDLFWVGYNSSDYYECSGFDAPASCGAGYKITGNLHRQICTLLGVITMVRGGEVCESLPEEHNNYESLIK